MNRRGRAILVASISRGGLALARIATPVRRDSHCEVRRVELPRTVGEDRHIHLKRLAAALPKEWTTDSPALYLVLYRGEYNVTKLELPPGNARETRGMAELRLQTLIPCDFADVAWGCKRGGIAHNDNQRDVTVCWLPSKRLLDAVSEFEQRGVHVAAVYPDLFLIEDALSPRTEKNNSESAQLAVQFLSNGSSFGSALFRWDSKGQLAESHVVEINNGQTPDHDEQSSKVGAETSLNEVCRLPSGIPVPENFLEKPERLFDMLPGEIRARRSQARRRSLTLQIACLALLLALLVAIGLLDAVHSTRNALAANEAEIARLRPGAAEVEAMTERIYGLRSQLTYTVSPLEAILQLNQILSEDANKLAGLYLDGFEYDSSGSITIEGHATNDITPWRLAEAVRGTSLRVEGSPNLEFRSLGAGRSIRFSIRLKPAEAAQP